MSYALIGRLREASFRGVSFLVSNSSIQFGQKNAVYQYPGTNKTEVKYLGEAEDRFSLDLYVHGSGLIEKRRRLKDALKQGKDGTLIHPYEGEINCAVLSARVNDNDRNLGISRFTVVFQKTTATPQPTESANNTAGILGAINSFLSESENTIDFITNNYSPNAIAQASKLNNVFDTFDSAVRLTYKVADKANEFNQELDDFKRKINVYVSTPSVLKDAFTSLFNSFNFIAEDSVEQLRLWTSFFQFGDDDREIDETTLERKERASNNRIINNAMKANSLALAYGTIVEIEPATSDDVDNLRQLVEDQYEAIKEDLDNDVVNALDDVRELTLNYMDNLDVANVVTYDTQSTSLVLLTHALYGNQDNYDTLNDLNKFDDPAFIQGEVDVINE